ncbi:RAMP superfamily CRISPR-associated protein [Sulfolobus tengchongensis]|uniref:RAMP superfamily CRISPR-associated protein n=1 Tax=Sulfolobus tengchongensis TaxID=207809 RepID=A0AAX4L1P9_9CREN
MIYIFKLKFNMPYGFRVGGTKQESNLLEALYQIDEQGSIYYLIPFSSWKGVFRRVTEMLVNSQSHFNNHSVSEDRVNQIYTVYSSSIEECVKNITDCDNDVVKVAIAKGIISKNDRSHDKKTEFAKLVEMWNCPVEKIYGSEYFAGSITISDSIVYSGVLSRTHAVIDRKSKKVLERHLYTEHIVDVNSVNVNLILRDYIKEWLDTLRFMANVGTFIGGSKSRGIGYIKLDTKESEFAEVRDITAKPVFKPLSDLL